MLTVPMDPEKVSRCRRLAAAVADDVQRYIDAHTSVGVERTILRAYGVDGVDDQGAPLVNVVVDRYAKPNLLFISIDTLRADHLGTYGYPRPTSPRITDASASEP